MGIVSDAAVRCHYVWVMATTVRVQTVCEDDSFTFGVVHPGQAFHGVPYEALQAGKYDAAMQFVPFGT